MDTLFQKTVFSELMAHPEIAHPGNHLLTLPSNFDTITVTVGSEGLKIQVYEALIR
jgi:hypothetical protein